jgi:actin-like ATPase involved in cell morphogenesis
VGYRLGVDLGTTYAAAAVNRGRAVEMATLGNRSPELPSVLYLREDGTMLVGAAAERRGATDPLRLAREFKRRIGDPTPILLGGSPWSAEALTARLLRSVLDAVTEREGEAPESVTIAHPASWGPYKREVLEQAVHLADVENARYVPEPVAAALHYAQTERVGRGETVAVYDLGGGTFDATVLRRTGQAFQLLGTPEGIEHLGGVDFDEAIFQRVLQALEGQLDGLFSEDAEAEGTQTSADGNLAALQRLRRDCVDAKEALSTDTEVSIPVVLPSLQTTVRLSRDEFETLIRPSLAETVAAMKRALRSAGVRSEDLKAVVLVGGSSRIPLVSEIVTEALGRPVALDTHPKHSVAIGAALSTATSSRATTDAATPGTAGVPHQQPPAEQRKPRAPEHEPSSEQEPETAVVPDGDAVESTGLQSAGRRTRLAAVGALVAVVVAVALVAVPRLWPDGEGGTATDSPTGTATTTPAPSATTDPVALATLTALLPANVPDCKPVGDDDKERTASVSAEMSCPSQPGLTSLTAAKVEGPNNENEYLRRWLGEDFREFDSGSCETFQRLPERRVWSDPSRRTRGDFYCALVDGKPRTAWTLSRERVVFVVGADGTDSVAYEQLVTYVKGLTFPAVAGA